MAFQAFAIETRNGPHVTVQAGVRHRARFWTTTSRRSLKTSMLRERPTVAVAQRMGDGSVTVSGGDTVVFDPRHPLSVLGDPVGALSTGSAVARLGLEQLSQLVGYVESRSMIPADWLPLNRVLLVTRLESEVGIDAGGRVTRASGAWDRDPVELAVGPERTAPPDLGDVPSEQRELLAEPCDRAWLGVLTSDGPAVLPASWDPARGVTVGRAPLEILTPQLPGPVCVTVDDSRGRRPDEKSGAMLRGRGVLSALSDDQLCLSIDPARVTYWYGFDADTVDAA